MKEGETVNKLGKIGITLLLVTTLASSPSTILNQSKAATKEYYKITIDRAPRIQVTKTSRDLKIRFNDNNTVGDVEIYLMQYDSTSKKWKSKGKKEVPFEIDKEELNKISKEDQKKYKCILIKENFFESILNNETEKKLYSVEKSGVGDVFKIYISASDNKEKSKDNRIERTYTLALREEPNSKGYYWTGSCGPRLTTIGSKYDYTSEEKNSKYTTAKQAAQKFTIGAIDGNKLTKVKLYEDETEDNFVIFDKNNNKVEYIDQAGNDDIKSNAQVVLTGEKYYTFFNKYTTKINDPKHFCITLIDKYDTTREDIKFKIVKYTI